MKRVLISVLAAASFSAALADGLSATLNVPVLPGFGISGSLNYTANIAENAVVGIRLLPSYTPSTGFAFGTRLGAAYVLKLTEFEGGYAEAAVRAGVNFGIAPAFSWSLDTGAELFATGRIASDLVAYGGATLTLPLLPSFANPVTLGTYAGLKLELTKDLDAYAETNVSIPFGGSVSFDLTGSLYATLASGARLGLYTGIGSAGFKIGLAADLVEKPQTIGTPGNYLP